MRFLLKVVFSLLHYASFVWAATQVHLSLPFQEERRLLCVLVLLGGTHFPGTPQSTPLVFSSPPGPTQFRGAQISWLRVGGPSALTVNITVVAAWNVAGVVPGDGLIVNFGDGSVALLALTSSTLIGAFADFDGTVWVSASFNLTHAYKASRTFAVSTSGCCRASAVNTLPQPSFFVRPLSFCRLLRYVWCCVVDNIAVAASHFVGYPRLHLHV